MCCVCACVCVCVSVCKHANALNGDVSSIRCMSGMRVSWRKLHVRGASSHSGALVMERSHRGPIPLELEELGLVGVGGIFVRVLHYLLFVLHTHTHTHTHAPHMQV